MHHFLKHPFFRQLLSLHLPQSDFAIAGSGPLFARYLIDEIGDVDVVARGAAWALASKLGEPTPAPYSNVQQIRLFDGNIEVLDGWFPEVWKVDDLIESADVIEGVRFVPLDVVRRTKQILGRPNDLLHLRLMEAELSDNGG
jgi:hypothetical protein